MIQALCKQLLMMPQARKPYHGPFSLIWIILKPRMDRLYTHYQAREQIVYSFPYFSGATIEV